MRTPLTGVHLYNILYFSLLKSDQTWDYDFDPCSTASHFSFEQYNGADGYIPHGSDA
jgi:hypothetical protein